MRIFNTIGVFMTLIATAGTAHAQKGALVSHAANRTGTHYVNPIICADYSDPDAVASPDGKTFYMTASSFQCSPGLPILKSTDLVNWSIVNYALPAVPPTDFYNETPRHGKGVWAPCIRYHDGFYYIFWGDPDHGVFMTRTADPEGSWSEPVLVKGGKGWIDPSPLWDTDGKAYLVNGWAASRSGFNSIITMSEMSPDGTHLLGEPQIVYDGNDGINHTIEGPKLYKHGDYYYIFAPAGGVENGWQLVMRSTNPAGPYESRIVMAQGNTDINGPHQGAWVSTATGEDWFLHFQDQGIYGRVIHLNPMKWVDDWPVIGTDKDGDGCGEPVRRYHKPALESDMAVTTVEDPSLLYEWHGNYNEFFGFSIPDGLRRIYSYRLSPDYVNFWEVPNQWLMKFPAREFMLTSQVRISAKSGSDYASSGIIVMGYDYGRLGAVKSGDSFDITFTTCHDAENGGKETTSTIATLSPTRTYSAGLMPNLELILYLRVKVKDGGKCSFSYSTDGKKYKDCGQLQATKGKWIGAKLGFYSIVPDGKADKGWIDILTSDLVID